MSEPIRIRARARDGKVDVTLLMPHPMETGLRKDGSGQSVKAHFIDTLRVTTGSRVLLEARMSLAVSRDPLIAFRFTGGRPGDPIRVTWTDNRGEHRTDDSVIL